jgi:hypothetical protein
MNSEECRKTYSLLLQDTILVSHRGTEGNRENPQSGQSIYELKQSPLKSEAEVLNAITQSISTYTGCPPEGKVNILGSAVSGILSKKMYMYMCPIPNSFRDRAMSLYSTLYTAQTSNTPCPHTSCKVHWCWRCNFRKCIILSKRYQLCHLSNKYRY